jgi:hypothetical protein
LDGTLSTVDLTDDEKDATEQEKIVESDSSSSSDEDENDDINYFNFFINNIDRKNNEANNGEVQIEVVTDNDESQDLLA